MTRRDAFALGLILGQQDSQQEAEVHTLAEEEEEVTEGEPPAMSEQFIIDASGVKASRPFVPEDTTGKSLPVEGPGTLVSALLISPSKAFNVRIEIDNREIISEAFADLQTISTELERISAYERDDGTFVFQAADYEFQTEFTVEIRPRQTIIFNRIRVEADLVR